MSKCQEIFPVNNANGPLVFLANKADERVGLQVAGALKTEVDEQNLRVD
jgi:hypothetical protein